MEYTQVQSTSVIAKLNRRLPHVMVYGCVLLPHVMVYGCVFHIPEMWLEDDVAVQPVAIKRTHVTLG
jgi:hypothetical protein